MKSLMERHMMDRKEILLKKWKSQSNAGIQQPGFMKAQLDLTDMIIDQMPRSECHAAKAEMFYDGASLH